MGQRGRKRDVDRDNHNCGQPNRLELTKQASTSTSKFDHSKKRISLNGSIHDDYCMCLY